MNQRAIPIVLLIAALMFGCSSNPTIVMLTDFGWDDPYAGAMQGAILTIHPEARLVTITHAAPDYDIREASYILATAAKEFPEKTIFLAVVDPGVGGDRRPIIVETLDEKLYIAPDNGILTDVLRSSGLKRAVEINNVLWHRRGAISSTFHGRDIFGPAAAHLAAGKDMKDAGPAVEEPLMFERVPAKYSSETGMSGEIIHRDHYGNLITNVPATELARSGWQPGMNLEFEHRGTSVLARFVKQYSEVGEGEYALVVNGQGLLELARNMHSAGQSLKAAAGDPIVIKTAGSPKTEEEQKAAQTAAK